MLVSAKLLCQIELAWVCRHSGITGNKVVDGIAVQLTYPFLPRTEGNKKTIKIYTEQEWQQIWQSLQQCGIAKSFFAAPTTQHRRFIKWMSTKEFTTIKQAVTGHGFFAGHLSRWRESLLLTYKLCRETEGTSLHLWGKCPALELERTQLSRVGSDGRHKTPRHLGLDFFEHEKVR